MLQRTTATQAREFARWYYTIWRGGEYLDSFQFIEATAAPNKGGRYLLATQSTIYEGYFSLYMGYTTPFMAQGAYFESYRFAGELASSMSASTHD